MKLNEKILYYRRSRKLSQEELAELVGVSRQSVSKWELGEATPEVGKLVTLARVFGITTDELLSEADPAGRTEREPEEQGACEPRPEEPQLDRMVGFIGRMVRRFGWLAGVYTALAGAGISLVGGIARYAFGAMLRANSNVWNDLGGGFMMDDIYVMDWSGGGFGGMGSTFDTVSRVPMVIATAILVIGLCIMAAGIIGAVVLYNKREK